MKILGERLTYLRKKDKISLNELSYRITTILEQQEHSI